MALLNIGKKKIVVLGHGDVMICSGVDVVSGNGHVKLKHYADGVINYGESPDGVDHSKMPVLSHMRFDDTESLDKLITSLQKVRQEMLFGELEDILCEVDGNVTGILTGRRK